MINSALFKVNNEERKKIVDYLIESSYPGAYFFVMLIASAIIATVGLILDNSSIVIGSMLVAPFLSPILSLGMGISMSDFNLIKRSIKIVAKATGVVVATSLIFALFVPMPETYPMEITSRIVPSLPYMYVAIAAGIAACFAITKRGLSEFLVGVAVSVALLPPLATIGIGLRLADLNVILGSFQLFMVNLLGIIFSALAIFSLMGFYPSRATAEKAIKEEEKKLDQEKN